MSRLSELLRARELTTATPATPATHQPESSNSSESSRGAEPASHFAAVPPAPEPRTVTCCACLHYSARPGASPDGFCRRFDVEAWAGVLFTCDGFEAKDDAVRARESRQARAEGELRAHPDQRLAFDVVDAPLTAGPGATVSVVLAVRHGAQFLSGELHVPREQWNPALFLSTVTESTVRPS